MQRNSLKPQALRVVVCRAMHDYFVTRPIFWEMCTCNINLISQCHTFVYACNVGYRTFFKCPSLDNKYLVR